MKKDRQITNNEIIKMNNARAKHKEIFYELLTEFASLDTMVSFYIASHFVKRKEKITEITDLIISELNSQKQFDVFLRLLSINNFDMNENTIIQDLYNSVRPWRNKLAHSFFLGPDNFNYNEKGIKLTYLHNSKGKGYSIPLDLKEYECVKLKLGELRSKINSIVSTTIAQ